MAMNIVEKIDDAVQVKNMLVSVSDKSGLDTFIPQLRETNPEIKIFSTGGTFNKIKEILSDDAGDDAESCLTQVSDYTGQPETQGGLVKTLDFKIYLGLLTETYNDDHQADLKRTDAVAIDMVVANLYPFKETISKEGVTVAVGSGQQERVGAIEQAIIKAYQKAMDREDIEYDPIDGAADCDRLPVSSIIQGVLEGFEESPIGRFLSSI